MAGAQLSFINKRKGPDFVLRLITWIQVVGWMLIIAVLVIIAKAGPQSATFFDRLLEVDISTSWDLDLIRYAYYLMIAMLSLGILGLLLNSRRMRRKSDHYRLSLIIMVLFSVVGIILYSLSF